MPLNLFPPPSPHRPFAHAVPVPAADLLFPNLHRLTPRLLPVPHSAAPSPLPHISRSADSSLTLLAPHFGLCSSQPSTFPSLEPKPSQLLRVPLPVPCSPPSARFPHLHTRPYLGGAQHAAVTTLIEIGFSMDRVSQHLQKNFFFPVCKTRYFIHTEEVLNPYNALGGHKIKLQRGV